MSNLPKGTRALFRPPSPPSGWKIVGWPPPLGTSILCEYIGGDVLCEMSGAGSSPPPEDGTRCPECKRKMHKSATRPGQVYCSWCRKFADAV